MSLATVRHAVRALTKRLHFLYDLKALCAVHLEDITSRTATPLKARTAACGQRRQKPRSGSAQNFYTINTVSKDLPHNVELTTLFLKHSDYILRKRHHNVRRVYHCAADCIYIEYQATA